jgi:hypothetical protein
VTFNTYSGGSDKGLFSSFGLSTGPLLVEISAWTDSKNTKFTMKFTILMLKRLVSMQYFHMAGLSMFVRKFCGTILTEIHCLKF